MAAEQVAFDYVDDWAGYDRDSNGIDQLHHEPFVPKWRDEQRSDVFVSAEDVYGDGFDGWISCSSERSGDYDDVPLSCEPSRQGSSVHQHR